MGCAAPGFEISRSVGQGRQGIAASYQSDPAVVVEQIEDLHHGADVGAAQDRVGVLDRPDESVDVWGALQTDRCFHDRQPAVGFLRQGWAEPEGLREGELVAVEVGHHVACSPPAVDGLGGVADHDQLGVHALVGEDLLDHRVGVLRFVQEQVVGMDLRLGQGPHFQVVVVLEADHAFVGILQVLPGLAGVREDDVSQLEVKVLILQAAEHRDVVRAEVRVDRIAEPLHGAQHGV